MPFGGYSLYMNRLGRFLYRYKILIMNIFLGGLIFGLPVRIFDDLEPESTFHYFLGVAVIASFFMEIGAIYYKYRFIYSKKGARGRKIPGIYHVAFFPRVLISGGLGILAFYGLGFLDYSDFLFIIIALYAAMKEFWLRSNLLNPEGESTPRPNRFKVWMGEAFLFIFIALGYYVFWELYLLDNPRLLGILRYPQNYIFIAIVAYIVFLALQMPLFFENYIRGQSRKEKVIAYFSVLLPTLGVVFQFFAMGYLQN